MRDHPSGRPIRERIVKARPDLAGRRTFPIVERRAAPPVEQLAGGAGFVIFHAEPEPDSTVMRHPRKHRTTEH